jgi:hypothetical protein
MQTASDTALWYDDGHVIWLELNRSEVVVTTVMCPGGEGAACRHPRIGCVVQYFVNAYGLECNVGICPAAEQIQIAWTLIGGDPSYSDLDECQIWIVPTADDIFSSWAETMRRG